MNLLLQFFFIILLCRFHYTFLHSLPLPRFQPCSLLLLTLTLSSVVCWSNFHMRVEYIFILCLVLHIYLKLFTCVYFYIMLHLSATRTTTLPNTSINLSAISHRLLATCYQLSFINYKLPTKLSTLSLFYQ